MKTNEISSLVWQILHEAKHLAELQSELWRLEVSCRSADILRAMGVLALAVAGALGTLLMAFLSATACLHFYFEFSVVRSCLYVTLGGTALVFGLLILAKVFWTRVFKKGNYGTNSSELTKRDLYYNDLLAQ